MYTSNAYISWNISNKDWSNHIFDVKKQNIEKASANNNNGENNENSSEWNVGIENKNIVWEQIKKKNNEKRSVNKYKSTMHAHSASDLSSTNSIHTGPIPHQYTNYYAFWS